MVSASRGPPFAKYAAIIVGVHDGMGALARLLLPIPVIAGGHTDGGHYFSGCWTPRPPYH